MVTQEEIQAYLKEHPELAEALRIFEVSTASYTQAIAALNPTTRYTSTSTQDLRPSATR